MRSNWQTIWSILCDFARRQGFFEIDDAVPQIAARLGVSDTEASREVAFLLEELSRLPEGRQFFRVEGYGVAPLPEFLSLPDSENARAEAYPFEL